MLERIWMPQEERSGGGLEQWERMGREIQAWSRGGVREFLKS